MSPTTKLIPPLISSQPKLSRIEFASIIITAALAIALGLFAGISARNEWLLWTAVSVGGLGGLAHEFAQSGGKILFFERRADGIYIGAVAGMVLGAVAGLLAIKGFLLVTDPKTVAEFNYREVTYEAFIAGLGLKGIVEAAGGQAVPQGPGDLSTFKLPAPPSVVPPDN